MEVGILATKAALKYQKQKISDAFYHGLTI